MKFKGIYRQLLPCAALLSLAGFAYAQVPPDIEAQLHKIGQIVDPICTPPLYRPLMPKADYNTYWPVGAAAPADTKELYPGVRIIHDQSFGPNPKDLVDVFTGDKGPASRPVIIYVPGGGGNKIEQQTRDSNAFYDNIGRWATKNGMVGVLIQRHQGTAWDDGGRDIAAAVDWVYDNVSKYKGDPNRMVIWAHSAGNGPLGVYVTHPDRWKNGVRVKGAIFMSGNPAPAQGGGRGRGPGGPGGAPGGANAAGGPGSACGKAGANMASDEGSITGPSSYKLAAGGGGRGRGAQLTPEEQKERDNRPGILATNAKLMFAYAELDPGVVNGKMPEASLTLHDELCKTVSGSAKDGEGRCPVMLVSQGESHMSEVFSIDSPDKNVSGPVLNFIKLATKK